MRKTGIATFSIGLIGLGTTMIASPATAAIDCGTAPAGGTLTQGGDYCQVAFSTPGDFGFNVPSSATELYSLVAGAGSGVDIFDGASGYAGNGGQVKFTDLTASLTLPLAIHVGLGGASNPTGSEVNAGGDSSVNSGSQSGVAFGGVTNARDHKCNFTGYMGQLGVGNGARTAADINDLSVACTGHEGHGVNPHNGDVDSAGSAVPTIFSDLDQNFGEGGIAQLDTVMPSGLDVGSGANLVVTMASSEISTNTSAHGSDGQVILRWKSAAAATPTLAETGAAGTNMNLFGFASIVTGLGVMSSSLLRKRATK